MLRDSTNISRLLLVAVALAALPLAGCSDEKPTNNRSSDSGSVDQPASCGVKTQASCNPVSLSGCQQSFCYVVKLPATPPKSAPVCACAAGTAKAGEACNTTTDCVPGHSCAGTVAPGTCQPNCDPKAPACDSEMFCQEIQNGPEWGFCKPIPPDAAIDAGGPDA